MKRSVAFALMGIAMATTAYGQGGITFNNAQPDSSYVYHPIVWDAATPGLVEKAPPSNPDGVASTDGVVVNIWYAFGNNVAPDTKGPAVLWDTTVNESLGYYGYYGPTDVYLPAFTPGDIYTFQLRASGDSIYGAVDEGRSVSGTWTEDANIANLNVSPTPPYGVSDNHMGLTVYTVIPEPTTFALAGLGAAALLIFRRRD